MVLFNMGVPGCATGVSELETGVRALRQVTPSPKHVSRTLSQVVRWLHKRFCSLSLRVCIAIGVVMVGAARPICTKSSIACWTKVHGLGMTECEACVGRKLDVVGAVN